MTASVSFRQGFEVHKGAQQHLVDFIQKLMENPDSKSLNLERLNNSRDKRVRTARVNLQYRAVLLELNANGRRQFVLVKIDNHDEANAYAERLRVKADATNGVFEFISDTPSPTDAEIAAKLEQERARLKQQLANERAQEQAERERQEAEAAVARTETEGSASAWSSAVKPVKLPQRPPMQTLQGYGYDAAGLVEKFKLSAKAIARLEAASSEDELLKYFESDEIPEWEEDAIQGLLANLDPEEVLAEIQVAAPDVFGGDSGADTAAEVAEAGTAGAGAARSAAGAGADAEQSDEELIEQLEKSPYWYNTDDPKVQEVIDEGSFSDWRVFLHPTQQKAVTANHKGSARLLGGAGTGKTVVLLHRAKHLLEVSDNKARILLTTFTRSLSNQLTAQMASLAPSYAEATSHGAPGLWISGIDALIHRVLQNAHGSEVDNAVTAATGLTRGFRPSPLSGRDSDRLWSEAIVLNGDDLDRTKKQIPFLEDELNDVILTNGITEESAYLRVSRRGRRTQLGRNERKIVWNIVQAFLTKCAREERLPFPAIAMVGAKILENRKAAMFDHVLVDEGQDFHAGHWRFLRAAVAAGPNDIYLAEDSHQRIYGHRLVLAHYGIETRGRATQRLTLNYRTTAENLEYAAAILEGADWFDSAEELDSLAGYRSVRHGPRPMIARLDNPAEEFELVASTVQKWIAETDSPSLHIGVLANSKEQVAKIHSYLADHGIEGSTARSGQDVLEEKVSVLTMHNAKGMEFTHVILSDVSARAIPRIAMTRNLADAERDDALQRERALLYVAASRARDELLITVTGDPSDLLPFMDDER